LQPGEAFHKQPGSNKKNESEGGLRDNQTVAQAIPTYAGCG
jgi:hypothetical protein